MTSVKNGRNVDRRFLQRSARRSDGLSELRSNAGRLLLVLHLKAGMRQVPTHGIVHEHSVLVPTVSAREEERHVRPQQMLHASLNREGLPRPRTSHQSRLASRILRSLLTRNRLRLKVWLKGHAATKSA